MTGNNKIIASWESPSNIALVKYWGKKGPQIPANPSISFTLDNALTKTNIEAIKVDGQNQISIDFYFENEKNDSFEIKIKAFLEKVVSQFSWLRQYHLQIHSSNTFPHSSGIASSASAFSALSLCLCDLHQQITESTINNFFELASNWSRIGSGSASRSVYGGYNLWGKTPLIQNSSDEFAVNIDNQINSVFKNLKDTILIIEKGKKSVSSTKGHALLKEHPFASLRYQLANENIGLLLNILKNGEIQEFIALVEREALMLHSLMMTSPTPFILMKPNTIAVLEKIWDFRNQTGLNLLFTLDAGANVHLINTDEHNEQVQNFVKNELVGYCQNGLYFCNAVGSGPKKTKNA
ncbi:MAG: diphosphomevalonate decarboxylase [bacterium]|nr:diphosphomevalonate decarboxylase [bacterium]